MQFPLLVLLVWIGGLVLLYLQLQDGDSLTLEEEWEELMATAKELPVSIVSTSAKAKKPGCHFNSDCFDVYRCARANGKLKVYIYPPAIYVTQTGKTIAQFSMEFNSMLETVYSSDYYTPVPEDACIFIPSIDLLNSRNQDTKMVGRILAGLQFWNDGSNHLILNMAFSPEPLLTDQAILGSSDYENLRHGFDLPIPVLSRIEFETTPHNKPYLLSYQTSIDPKLRKIIGKESARLLILPPEISQYEKLLGKATFCLITFPLNPITLLTDCMSVGSIPVIVSGNPPVLPFNKVIDWMEISFQFRPASASTIVPTLLAVSPTYLKTMSLALTRAYSAHFSSPSKVMLTTLSILQQTIFSMSPNSQVLPASPMLTLSPPSPGCTALILTYSRQESLFTVITRLSQVQSLVRVVVVWNHQTVPPPPVEDWPRISKPLKVIQTSANKLSNRFYPYSEIETECILALDDDISMLSSDELEFGYQVWREFPDRIVGFPSRTHIYDNLTDQYKYESEWTNDLSMVLTGVSFYHKYWHYLYTAAPSEEQTYIKEWVDKHINCEDIAFNLMVANATGKAPIKVGPRKKFKCSTPSCENSGMLSASASHLEERSSCLHNFIKMYGHNPLKAVEFRADPVLYKDNFPDNLKMFKDIGSL